MNLFAIKATVIGFCTFILFIMLGGFKDKFASKTLVVDKGSFTESALVHSTRSLGKAKFYTMKMTKEDAVTLSKRTDIAELVFQLNNPDGIVRDKYELVTWIRKTSHSQPEKLDPDPLAIYKKGEKVRNQTFIGVYKLKMESFRSTFDESVDFKYLFFKPVDSQIVFVNYSIYMGDASGDSSDLYSKYNNLIKKEGEQINGNKRRPLASYPMHPSPPAGFD